MKHLLYLVLILVLTFIVGCKKSASPNQRLNKLPVGMHAVKLLDRIDASSYSYLEVSENGNDYWIAAPKIQANIGDTLYYIQSMEMKNFHSQKLNRTFDRILFVQNISKNPSSSQFLISAIHSGVNSEPEENIKIKPVKGGLTIAQVYSEKDKLAGKEITVRGKIIKFNANIMKRNWIHIQDGTSSNDNYDLLVTSTEQAEVGQVILVTGKVEINKDFGAGYRYSVLIANAKIKIE